MNWLTRSLPSFPKFLTPNKKENETQKWYKDPGAIGEMVHHRDLKEALWVFPSGYHMRINAQTRLELLFDNQEFEQIEIPSCPLDPLKFKDLKRYKDRLDTARQKSGNSDAILIGFGSIKKRKCVCIAFDFEFMGGSMGMAVGEGFIRACEYAFEQNVPLIAIPSSGGARMQEGILSLMQLPRTVVALSTLREKSLPFIVILSDPTTGGVSASFAMLGDVHIAEPGAMIGFAGKRVIEQIVREQLPPDFQTAEHMLEHGMIDMVIPRSQLVSQISIILDHLMHNTAPSQINDDQQEEHNDKLANLDDAAQDDEDSEDASFTFKSGASTILPTDIPNSDGVKIS